MVLLLLGIRLSDEMVLSTEERKIAIASTKMIKRKEILFFLWCIALFCVFLFINLFPKNELLTNLNTSNR